MSVAVSVCQYVAVVSPPLSSLPARATLGCRGDLSWLQFPAFQTRLYCVWTQQGWNWTETELGLDTRGLGLDTTKLGLDTTGLELDSDRFGDIFGPEI